MRRELVVVGLSAIVLGVGAAAEQAAKPAAVATAPAERFWGQWRGPLGTGEAPHAKPPVEWSETKNVRWKVEIPGVGKSSPIVWNDLVFITTAIPLATPATAPATSGATPPPATPGAAAGPGGRRHPDVSDPDGPKSFVVIALGREDGKERWRRVVREELPHEGTHRFGTFASGSTLTDGERLYAFFGSRGLYALDFTGKVLWEKQLGHMTTRNGFGEGSTPTVHAGTVVVTWDHEGADFIVAFDAATGKEKWRRERDEPTTWATPLVVVHGGRAQVIVAGTNRFMAYDLATGESIWQAGGLTVNQIPSPVHADGMVYAMGGYRGNMLRAINLANAKGEVTGPPGLAWSYERDTPYVPSPLLYRGGLYFLKSNSGILTYLDAKSGEMRYMERLDSVPNVYASPVAADGRVYVVGREGTTAVLAAGPKLERLATNVLADAIDTSPALVGNDLFLRGNKYLYRISAPAAGAARASR